MKKDIYIIRNTINNKCYVGQSVDYKTRFRKHKEEARRNNFHYKSYLYNAMNTLGIENFYVELLESQIEDYNEKEIYYIKKFNTLRPNGYNLAAGGNWYPNLKGIEHHSATVTSQEDLEAIYDELLNSEYTTNEIANHYNISPDTVRKINSGVVYTQEGFNYPLRELTLSSKKLERLTYDLKYSNLTYAELSDLYKISISQVKAINAGKAWYRHYLKYPLREMVFCNRYGVVEKIQKDLLSTNLSIEGLSKKYNCSTITIRRINNGETHKNEQLQYPLRKFNKLSSTDVKEIHKLLIENQKSINEISAQYNVSNATIKRMNSGVTKKYFDPTLTYPLRPM